MMRRTKHPHFSSRVTRGRTDRSRHVVLGKSLVGSAPWKSPRHLLGDGLKIDIVKPLEHPQQPGQFLKVGTPAVLVGLLRWCFARKRT
jgi:hypothetical protein